jgi:hypothetical protein
VFVDNNDQRAGDEMRLTKTELIKNQQQMGESCHAGTQAPFARSSPTLT